MSPSSAPQPAKTSRPTTDQLRAQWAWEQVEHGVSKDYVGLSKSVPTLIMTSGLVQTLAFLSAKSKSNKQHEDLLRQLLDALGLPAAHDQAIGELVKMNSATYRAKTEQAMALLRWLRHFASVMQKQKD